MLGYLNTRYIDFNPHLDKYGRIDEKDILQSAFMCYSDKIA